MMRLMVLNAALFQLLWFICVQGNNLLAPIATLVLLAIHARFLVINAVEWKLIIGFAVFGALLDSLVINVGLIEFVGNHMFSLGQHQIVIAPLWLLCLWLCFATTLCHSLFWLHRYISVAALASFCVIPLSYYAGAKVSGSVLHPPVIIPLAIEACLWAIVLPLGLKVAAKLSVRQSRGKSYA